VPPVRRAESGCGTVNLGTAGRVCRRLRERRHIHASTQRLRRRLERSRLRCCRWRRRRWRRLLGRRQKGLVHRLARRRVLGRGRRLLRRGEGRRAKASLCGGRHAPKSSASCVDGPPPHRAARDTTDDAACVRRRRCCATSSRRGDGGGSDGASCSASVARARCPRQPAPPRQRPRQHLAFRLAVKVGAPSESSFIGVGTAVMRGASVQ